MTELKWLTIWNGGVRNLGCLQLSIIIQRCHIRSLRPWVFGEKTKKHHLCRPFVTKMACERHTGKMAWHFFLSYFTKPFFTFFCWKMFCFVPQWYFVVKMPLFSFYIFTCCLMSVEYPHQHFSNRNMYCWYCKSNSIWDSDGIICVYSLLNYNL